MAIYDDAAVRELLLFQENEERLYRQELEIRKNLARKVLRGTYDPAKAPLAYKYLVDAAAKDYVREFGSRGDAVSSVFSVATRKKAALELAKDFTATVRKLSEKKLLELAKTGHWE